MYKQKYLIHTLSHILLVLYVEEIFEMMHDFGLHISSSRNST